MYLAELMAAHPLYPAARRLADDISRLSGAGIPAIAGAAGERWTTPLLAGPTPFDFPQNALESDWRDWEAGLVTLVPPADGTLPADLETARRWRDQQIDLEEARQRTVAEADESQKLAEFREKLVREHLAELTNAGLNLATPAAQAPGAEAMGQQAQETAAAAAREAETSKRVWDQIEAAVAQEAAASQQRLAQREAQVKIETAQRQAQVAAEVQAEAKARQAAEHPPTQAGRQEMEARMKEFAASPHQAGRPAPLAGAAPTGAEMRAAEQARAQALAAYEQTRQRQLQRLRESQAQLLRAILADVRLTAMRVAFEDNMRLDLVPPGEPRGRDLTDRVRRRLELIWTGRDVLPVGSGGDKRR